MLMTGCSRDVLHPGRASNSHNQCQPDRSPVGALRCGCLTWMVMCWTPSRVKECPACLRGTHDAGQTHARGERPAQPDELAPPHWTSPLQKSVYCTFSMPENGVTSYPPNGGTSLHGASAPRPMSVLGPMPRGAHSMGGNDLIVSFGEVICAWVGCSARADGPFGLAPGRKCRHVRACWLVLGETDANGKARTLTLGSGNR